MLDNITNLVTYYKIPKNICDHVICTFTAITVKFSQTTYSVNEDVGSVQFQLVLSGPSSTATIVEVNNTDGSATGEYCSILINY